MTSRKTSDIRVTIPYHKDPVPLSKALEAWGQAMRLTETLEENFDPGMSQTYVDALEACRKQEAACRAACVAAIAML
jgi:hypothetical protein